MSPKKLHETSRLAAYIIEKSGEMAISKIIDLGSGQGYLSHLLVSAADLNVTAIEGKSHNAVQAQKRAQRIDKGLHQQSGSEFQSICKIVTSDNIQEVTTEPCILIGLHTCGDLAANSLKLFAREENIRGVINVGCCYHHLTECIGDVGAAQEYLDRIGESEANRSLDQTLTNDAEAAGFPLSLYLRENSKGFFLGKLVRSLCISEPSQKSLNKAEINFKKLEYRAGFQGFLQDFYPEYQKVFALGNKIRKFKDFGEYTLCALKKMKLETGMSCGEINEYYDSRFKSLEKKASIMWVLRSVLSGPVENLIILDRLLYLEELGMRTQARSVFEKQISPRNVVIAAFKD